MDVPSVSTMDASLDHPDSRHPLHESSSVRLGPHRPPPPSEAAEGEATEEGLHPHGRTGSHRRTGSAGEAGQRDGWLQVYDHAVKAGRRGDEGRRRGARDRSVVHERRNWSGVSMDMLLFYALVRK